MSISVLLLTLNEEKNLPSCLAPLSWCDDIVVLDSLSTDGTREIAERVGARVYQRRFDTFAEQRNYALEEIPFKHSWILHLDADEIVTEALRDEMIESIRDTAFDAFRIPSKMILFGRWLRFAGMYPTYQVRLTRASDFRFRQVGHGQKEDIDQTRIGTLREPYLHYSFSKGMTEWIEKHNRYSSAEAYETLRQLEKGKIDWRSIVFAEPARRRKALKELSYRLPFRPLARFFYMYFLRLGILDGYPGFAYCLLLSWYEFIITLKVRELRTVSNRGS